MPIVIKQPETDTEYKDYYYFRWKILRKPLGGKLGEEQDGREKDSIHIMLKNEKNILAVGRLHFIENVNFQAQIRFMAVEDEFQSKGFGSLILSYLEKVAKEHGSSEILLHSRETAINFYKKNGYLIKKKSHLLLGKIQHWLMIKKI